jgi:hypothetical protein
MSIPTTESNKGGTGDRACACGSWKQHWINFSGKTWPGSCSVESCANKPTLGGHVINPRVTGEKIVPLCDSCNKRSGTFSLKDGTTVVSANKSQTCET